MKADSLMLSENLTKYAFWREISGQEQFSEDVFYGKNWVRDERNLGPHGCLMAAGAHGKHCDGGSAIPNA